MLAAPDDSMVYERDATDRIKALSIVDAGFAADAVASLWYQRRKARLPGMLGRALKAAWFRRSVQIEIDDNRDVVAALRADPIRVGTDGQRRDGRHPLARDKGVVDVVPRSVLGAVSPVDRRR